MPEGGDEHDAPDAAGAEHGTGGAPRDRVLRLLLHGVHTVRERRGEDDSVCEATRGV